MIQVLNPLFVVVLVPIFESLIYPCLDKLHIPNRPLQRMGVGMIFAATAFLLAGFLQIAIDKDFPPSIPSSEAKYQFVNPSSCSINVQSLTEGGINDTIAEFQSSEYRNVPAGESEFNVTWNGCLDAPVQAKNFTFNFAENTAYQLFADEFGFKVYSYTQQKIEPTGGSQSTVRFYNALHTHIDLSIKTVKDNQEKNARELGMVHQQNVSIYEEIILANYHVTVKVPSGYGDDNFTAYKLANEIYSENGAVYVVLLRYSNVTEEENIVMTQIREIDPWSVSIFLQVPQYFIITTGEILFSITGLSFAYSQAAPSMKSILTAIWLMTVAIGNVVVVIVAETGSAMSQMAEFFLFSGLMYVTTVIFAIMTMFYTYVDRNDWGAEQSSVTNAEDNAGLEMTDEKGSLENTDGFDDISIDSDKSEKSTKSKENKEINQDEESEYLDEKL